MNEADKYKRDQDLFFQELDRQEVQYERMRVHRLFERAKAVGMSYATTRLKLGLKHFTLDELEAEVCQKENAGQAPPIAIARSLPLLRLFKNGLSTVSQNPLVVERCNNWWEVARGTLLLRTASHVNKRRLSPDPRYLMCNVQAAQNPSVQL
jgi:hypothetical protein